MHNNTRKLFGERRSTDRDSIHQLPALKFLVADIKAEIACSSSPPPTTSPHMSDDDTGIRGMFGCYDQD